MLDINEILTHLASCKPYQPPRPRWKYCVERAGKCLFGIVVMYLVILGGFAWWHTCVAPLSRLLVNIVVACGYALLAVMWLSLLVLPLLAVFDLVGWKRTRPVSLLGEVATDERSVQFLLRQPEPQLQYAKHWLKVKAARVDGQVARWFGEKTTIFSLIALTFSSVKDFGGLPWLERTLAQSMRAGNYLSAVFLGALVFVFCLSLGAMMLKVLRERYAYQLELVELALTLKSLAQDKSSAAPQAVSPPPSAPGALRRMLRTLRRR
ncbi:hypothetical protein [Mycetohabitans sp. B46]|uniref:hypothetical protein n=1 Tax=Mycetohabitans sp. B46 TaxID=2772536 RepID=UPI00307D164E